MCRNWYSFQPKPKVRGHKLLCAPVVWLVTDPWLFSSKIHPGRHMSIPHGVSSSFEISKTLNRVAPIWATPVSVKGITVNWFPKLVFAWKIIANLRVWTSYLESMEHPWSLHLDKIWSPNSKIVEFWWSCIKWNCDLCNWTFIFSNRWGIPGIWPRDSQSWPHPPKGSRSIHGESAGRLWQGIYVLIPRKLVIWRGGATAGLQCLVRSGTPNSSVRSFGRQLSFRDATRVLPRPRRSPAPWPPLLLIKSHRALERNFSLGYCCVGCLSFQRF